MPNCILCNRPVVTGFVVHSDCLCNLPVKPISPNERMPANGQCVVVYWGDECMDIAYYFCDKDLIPYWQTSSVDSIPNEEVDYWFPLPDIPLK